MLIVVALALFASFVAAMGQVEPMRHLHGRSTRTAVVRPSSGREIQYPIWHDRNGGASVESLDVLSQRLTLSLDAFYAGVVRGEQERQEAAAAAERAAQERAGARSVGADYGVGSPPARNNGNWESFAACVIAHESGGVADAQNRYSSASGLFQDLDSTWGGYGGYAHAKDAPESVQYQMNYELWQRAGSSPWNGSGC